MDEGIRRVPSVANLRSGHRGVYDSLDVLTGLTVELAFLGLCSNPFAAQAMTFGLQGPGVAKAL